MPTAILFYDVVLWVHVMAVVVGLGGIFLAPVLTSHEARRVLWTKYVNYGLLVVIIAGAYLATDRDLWSEPWVSGSLLIAIVLGGMAAGVFAPREEKLAGLDARSSEYSALASQTRTLTYVAMGLVALAAFLMVTKLGG